MRRAAKKYLILLALAALVTALAPASSVAHFDRVVASSRQVALGGAFTTLVRDASASVLNPAALTQLFGWSVLSTYDRPYGLDDVDEAFVAGAIHIERVGAIGVAVHHLGLREVMSENLFTLAYARDLLRTSEDASLSAGVNVDFAHVSVSDRFDVSEGKVTGGASILLRPFPAIGMSYVVRNIHEPEFDLIAGGGKTTLEREQSWGASFMWHQRVTLSYEHRKSAGDWRDHVGVEVDLGPHLDVRSGVGRGLAAGGVGITWRGVTLDAGFASHDDLGSSYVMTLGYAPPRPVNPYVQTP